VSLTPVAPPDPALHLVPFPRPTGYFTSLRGGRTPSPQGVRISPFGAALSGYMPPRAGPWPRPIPDPRLMAVAGDQGRTGDLPDVLAGVAEPR
jgi:hypothetical protein